VSAERAMLSRSWRVGRYTATLTVPPPRRGQIASAVIEWEPKVPGHLTEAELDQYRNGRDGALADLAGALGITAAVVEL